MNKENRYKRQITLPEVGLKGQKNISNASVLCIGAGGLGCPALLYLAAAGVGTLGIIDFDVVDKTNLQRQILFTPEDINKNKALAAKERLNALNPEIKIKAYPEELTDQNAEDLFKDYDIIIDGTDNFAAKFLINDASFKTDTPLVYGSIQGFDGQVAVFNHNNGPCYRCLHLKEPESAIPNCAEAGVIGAVAGIVGTTQAMEVLKILINHQSFETLTNKLWMIDTRTMETRKLSLPKNEDCLVCTKEGKEITLQYTSPSCFTVSEITPEQAQAHKSAVIMDVREIDEWHAGHISNAVHMALSGLKQEQTPDLPTNTEIILYCQKGKRGRQAFQILKSRGYLNISNMTGGYEAWIKQII